MVTTPNIPTTTYVLQKKLLPGATYTWQVTAANMEYQDASFRRDERRRYGGVAARLRGEFKESHLALGLLAEHYGLLTHCGTRI